MFPRRSPWNQQTASHRSSSCPAWGHTSAPRFSGLGLTLPGRRLGSPGLQLADGRAIPQGESRLPRSREPDGWIGHRCRCARSHGGVLLSCGSVSLKNPDTAGPLSSHGELCEGPLRGPGRAPGAQAAVVAPGEARGQRTHAACSLRSCLGRRASKGLCCPQCPLGLRGRQAHGALATAHSHSQGPPAKPFNMLSSWHRSAYS